MKEIEKFRYDRTESFDGLADTLLNKLSLKVFGTVCRLLEVEFYLCSKNHPDPFVHNDPLQQQFGMWYLHRNGGTLKNGSFKGIDLAIGRNGSYFGVLIRSIKTDDQVVCGPCLCVDFMIKQGQLGSVHALQEQIEKAQAWSMENPVTLVESEFSGQEEYEQVIYQSPRIGLSTKHDTELHDDFGERSYRYLIVPRKIKKGRPELIKGLARSGYSEEEIKALTGSPAKSIAKYSKL